MKTPINKVLYIGFVLLGLYQLISSKDFMLAASSLGIALAFDPFNSEQHWKERPSWQILVLIVHLSIVFGLILIEMYNKFF